MSGGLQEVDPGGRAKEKVDARQDGALEPKRAQWRQRSRETKPYIMLCTVQIPGRSGYMCTWSDSRTCKPDESLWSRPGPERNTMYAVSGG